MLQALTLLVACQFVGEVISRGAGLAIPGPVIGLVLLLILLALRGGPSEELRETAGGLLRHLSLLFVPAGVGVVTQLGALERNWVALVVAIPVSTAIGLAVTGWVMQRLSVGRPG